MISLARGVAILTGDNWSRSERAFPGTRDTHLYGLTVGWLFVGIAVLRRRRAA